jgi:hypothetical protein
MTFSTTSFFAGVGTVFAAVMIGFAGGALITSSPKMEPNRLERVAAGNQVIPAAAAKVAETPAVPSVPVMKAEAVTVPATKPEAPAPAVVAKNEAPETSGPDRVVAMTPATAAQPAVPVQAQPVVAKEPRDDATSQIDNAKIRESELKKQAADSRESERRTEQRRERSRKRQEIEAAANAVRRMQRDGAIQEVTQQDDGPRLGFFGHD